MTVKSALRVLQMLEHFDEAQCALTALQLGKALGWPASSTWALLQTLVESGYLTFDARAKTYLPTERVSILGLWAYTPLFGEGRLLQLMHRLRARLGGRVVLAAQTGNLVRYIHTVQGTRPGNWYFRRGTAHPLLTTAIGRLFLSLYEDNEATRIIHRLNAERSHDDPLMPIGKLVAELREIRLRGYAVSINRMARGYGTVSMLLPRVYGQGRPLAIGITQATRIVEGREAQIAKRLKHAINRHFSDLAD